MPLRWAAAAALAATAASSPAAAAAAAMAGEGCGGPTEAGNGGGGGSGEAEPAGLARLSLSGVSGRLVAPLLHPFAMKWLPTRPAAAAAAAAAATVDSSSLSQQLPYKQTKTQIHMNHYSKTTFSFLCIPFNDLRA